MSLTRGECAEGIDKPDTSTLETDMAETSDDLSLYSGITQHGKGVGIALVATFIKVHNDYKARSKTAQHNLHRLRNDEGDQARLSHAN